ncbi:hypothetical protein KFL_002820060 [Klebsormidium nitens]|uniref:Uncharacterized protein n=1 Tax=Klebsormidium nitens TaxID=105231 RepID=A0A1Y1I5S5_KLENI|nr:hypothetical protein KFL_002820060 [Klebsormidium nitens]|eukprot:GAQ86310.1 hypothetical protein KFL_002820060 [Klebsormidium nitens]
MASKAERSRAPFFTKWAFRRSRKAHCSSSKNSIIESPALKTSWDPQPELGKASVGVQTDAPATIFVSTQTDPDAAKPAADEVKAFAQQNEDLRARVAVLAKAQADARTEAAALRAENASLQLNLSETENEHKKEVSGLREALESHREVCRRSDDERERFRYVLACNGQEGSVPRSVLASAPESLLYKIVLRGLGLRARRQGARALNVPSATVARHWNLQRLVDGLEVPGVTVTNDADLRGFKARCTFVSVMKQLSAGKEDLCCVFPGPQERYWAVEISDRGPTLGSVIPMTVPKSRLGDLQGIKVRSMKFRLLLRSEDPVMESAHEEFPCGEELCIRFDWVTLGGYGLQQILSEPLARAPDSLVIEVEVRYV